MDETLITHLGLDYYEDEPELGLRPSPPLVGPGPPPVALGTWGAAVGAVASSCLLWAKTDWIFSPVLLVLATAALTWSRGGRPQIGTRMGDDPKPFVLDELVWMRVSLLGHTLTGTNLLLGFVLFRVFDIRKLLGIRRLESIPRGWGVMLDYVGAGILANVLLWGWQFAPLHF